jgi:hypothetical protein
MLGGARKTLSLNQKKKKSKQKTLIKMFKIITTSMDTIKDIRVVLH